jgi:transcription elongation factor Elf1
VTTLDQQTCPHHGLDTVEATQIADPERRYLNTCRGCGLQYTEFECGRCGQMNAEPKACGCRKS